MPSHSDGRVLGHADDEKKSANQDHEDDDYESPACAVSGAIFIAHSKVPLDLFLTQRRPGTNPTTQRHRTAWFRVFMIGH
jgi:hypothetical protein